MLFITSHTSDSVLICMLQLLDLVQRKLGFTYDVHDMPVLGDESFTDMMKRHLGADSPDATADIGLEYWLRSSERLQAVSLLSGHIDGASVLIARVEPAPTMPFWDQVTRFLRPYDWWLWVALIGMIFTSGIVDYILELQSKEGARFGESIYEYAGMHPCYLQSSSASHDLSSASHDLSFASHDLSSPMCTQEVLCGAAGTSHAPE